MTFYCDISAAAASMVDVQKKKITPALTVSRPLSDPGSSEFTSASNIDPPFYFIQNEDFSDEGDETEQGGEDKGSACPRGPRGPVGPPGIEVGSKNLVTQCCT